MLDAYTGHAGAVTAFLRDSEATRSRYETAEFVPLREPARLVADFRFDTGASTNLARTGLGAYPLSTPSGAVDE